MKASQRRAAGPDCDLGMPKASPSPPWRSVWAAVSAPSPAGADDSALPRPSRRRIIWTGDELASAEALIADGASLHEIARTLNIPYGSVQPRFRYRGWTPQQAGAWSAELRRLRRAGADL